MRKYYVCMPLHKLTLRVTLVNDDICFLKMYFWFLQGAQYVTLLFLCVYLQIFIPELSQMNDDDEY